MRVIHFLTVGSSSNIGIFDVYFANFGFIFYARVAIR